MKAATGVAAVLLLSVPGAAPLRAQSLETWDATLYADTPAPLEYGDFGLRDCGFDIPSQLVLVPLAEASQRPAIRTFMPAGPGRNAFSDLGLPRGGAPHAVDLVELWCSEDDEPAALYVQRSHPEGRRLSRFLIPLAAFPGDLEVRWRDFVRVFTPSGDLVTPELVRRNERNWDLLPPSGSAPAQSRPSVDNPRDASNGIEPGRSPQYVNNGETAPPGAP